MKQTWRTPEPQPVRSEPPCRIWSSAAPLARATDAQMWNPVRIGHQTIGPTHRERLRRPCHELALVRAKTSFLQNGSVGFDLVASDTAGGQPVKRARMPRCDYTFRMALQRSDPRFWTVEQRVHLGARSIQLSARNSTFNGQLPAFLGYWDRCPVTCPLSIRIDCVLLVLLWNSFLAPFRGRVLTGHRHPVSLGRLPCRAEHMYPRVHCTVPHAPTIDRSNYSD